MKDSIDFGKMDVAKLFTKLLYPTVLGMIFSALFIITDGIFVGKGLGSDALAAVNITAPLFMINTGIALMFGVGASVVSSIHLSHGKNKTASINITQSILVSSILIVLLSVLVLCEPEYVARLFGCSDRLMSPAKEYIYGLVPFLVFSALLNSGMFFIRLDGSPKYAMMCNVIPAILNIILDYIFIFEFEWGMTGAAVATSLGYVIGAFMIIWYLLNKGVNICLYPIKLHVRSLRMTVRNVGYMCRIGFPSFLCEAAIATMMLTGNYVFMEYLGEDGVAAFSIACYFFPIIFMVYNAIAQSSQPILSYNYGAGYWPRVSKAFKVALYTSVIFGAVFFIITLFMSDHIVKMFLSPQYPAYSIAVYGLPFFSSGFVFFGINIVVIGYCQSIERDLYAMILTVMRGFIFLVLSFLIMPHLFGVEGIWLSVPVAEFLTTLLIILMFWSRKL